MLQALEADNVLEAARRAKERADRSQTATTSSGKADEGTRQTSNTPTPSTSGVSKNKPSPGPQAQSQESTEPSPYRTAPTHTEAEER